ncbi:hypothetical protein D3C80_569550 [compost metagenome]
MEQVDTVLPVRLQRQLLQPGHEGRDANAGTDPDLPRLLVFEGEAAVRAFHRHPVAFFQARWQPAGVIAQAFGDKAQLRRLRVPGRGDGVRVRPLRLG